MLGSAAFSFTGGPAPIRNSLRQRSLCIRQAVSPCPSQYRRSRLLVVWTMAADPAPPPADYDVLLAEAASSVSAGMRDGTRLMEVQFPPVPNMATAALNELLDANRKYAREFVRKFLGKMDAARVNVVFPDASEASLAMKTWGEVPFQIRAIPTWRLGKGPTPEYISGPGDGMVVIVSPGFNISEWINMEVLSADGSDPIVLLNGDLDKVRGGYYPRIFYPGLHKVKDRFLSRFEETYYLKMFSNGGTLMRRYGEPWTLRYRNADNNSTVLLQTFDERPDFVQVENVLRAARTDDLLTRDPRRKS